MKNIFKIIVCLSLLVITNNVFSQTYATPELKAQAEKWEAERLDWIKKNPEEYRKQGGDPEAYIKANTKVVEKPIELSTSETKNEIFNTSFYKLVNIIAVNPNNSLSKEELNIYQLDANSEFETYNIFIDWDKKLSYTTNKKTSLQNITDISYIKISKENNTYNCVDCGSLVFIKLNEDNSLTFRYQSQDNNKVFYDYSFTK